MRRRSAILALACWCLMSVPAGASGGVAEIVGPDGSTLANARLGGFAYPQDGSLVTVTAAAQTTSGGVSLTGITLLGGRVRIAAATTDGSGAITGLVVDGNAQAAASNQLVVLSGIGWAVADQRAYVTERDGSVRATTVAWHLHLTSPVGQVPAGSDVLIGFASSDQRPLAGAAAGIPAWLIPLYRAASARYGVPWTVLAAINRVETDFGSNLNVSSAGAIGWMQFLPSTWALYGVDANGDGSANPYDPADAIFAAARLLAADGAASNLAGAIWLYNHSSDYVNTVQALANAYATGGSAPPGVAQAAIAASQDDTRGVFSPVGLW
jgi:Transglycosylase SLT domain